jgi:hypothetical protein
MLRETVLAKKQLDGFWMAELGTRYLFYYYSSRSNKLFKLKMILGGKSGLTLSFIGKRKYFVATAPDKTYSHSMRE